MIEKGIFSFEGLAAVEALFQVNLSTYEVDQLDLLVKCQLVLGPNFQVIKAVHDFQVVEQIVYIGVIGWTEKTNGT